MQISNRKAIFIDIDGTLIADSNPPTEYNIAQLEKAQQQGHLIVLNTGRSYAFIPRALREASYIDGIVAGGGAHVILYGETLHHQTIPEDQLCAIADLYLRLGKWCQFEGEVYNYRVQESKGFLTISSAEDFLTKYKGAQVTKLTTQGEFLPEERALLHPWFYLYKMKDYSEGIIRGESKTGGIERILAATGIPWSDTVGIGDSENDIEMIMNVAFGIAMKNAVTELKQAADAVTDDCYHNGVGKAIARYVLNQPAGK